MDVFLAASRDGFTAGPGHEFGFQLASGNVL